MKEAKKDDIEKLLKEFNSSKRNIQEVFDSVIDNKNLKVKTITRPNYELAFETPEGVMDLNTYIAWLGNKVLEIEKALKSKK